MVAPLTSQHIEQQKALLRSIARQKRNMFLPSYNRRIIHLLERVIRRFRKKTIACVWPLPCEIDLRLLCYRLHRAQYSVVLPYTPPMGQELSFRSWTPIMSLRKGRFGTRYSAGLHKTPDVILVPLLAFDRQGGRLGYGGGYYDRTLAAHPHVPTVGYALSSQECDIVPMDQYDQRLSYIVTEREIISVHLNSEKIENKD